MRRIVVTVAFFLAFAVNAHAGSVIHVANGDCAAMASALASAPTDEQTTIVLANRGSYSSYAAGTSCELNVHQGDVTVEASGSEIEPFCLSKIIVVDAGARLTLRNASLGPASCGLSPPVSGEITNLGELQLESVNTWSHSIDNGPGATMTLRNVTSPYGIGTSDGNLEIYNSTLIADLYSSGPRLVLANSVVIGRSPDQCGIGGSHIQSLGGNVVSTRCVWAIASDRRTADGDAGLGLPQDNGGLGVPTLAPSSTSIVRGVGLAKYCEPVDARGLVRPRGACDAGAVQFDAVKDVGGGGMNGTWYDHAADGHYVTIQRVHDDDTALVIWNTFDSAGKQAWIYGVGHVVGRHIHVDMSQNVGGRLQAGGAPAGLTVRAWGTVDIDLTSCLEATMSYHSSVPGFGNGHFPLDRLAYVSDFGCAD